MGVDLIEDELLPIIPAVLRFTVDSNNALLILFHNLLADTRNMKTFFFVILSF